MKRLHFTVALLSLQLGLQAQSGLSLGTGTALTIKANTLFSADGLVLEPATDYTINGTNEVRRRASLLHPSYNTAIQRSYAWNQSLAPFTGTITLYYNDIELNSLQESDLTLNIHNGTQWQAYTASITRDGILNYVQTAGLSGVELNEISLAAFAAPLPLRWGPITASRTTVGAIVRWQTFNEEAVNDFIVERSYDSHAWIPLEDPLPASQSGGNHTYSFTDKKVEAGAAYYRILERDHSGRTAYSPVAYLTPLSYTNQVTLYPNPFIDKVAISSPVKAIRLLKVFSADGQLILQSKPINAYHYALTLTNLSAALYHIQVELSDGTVSIHQLIKK